MIDKNDKILITGVSGVLGFNLCEFLLSKGYRNIDVTSKNKLSVHHAHISKTCNHYLLDLSNEDEVGRIKTYDYIFNCAGYGQPKKFLSDPVQTFSLNTIGLAGLIKKTRKKFIFVSTSEIYGDSNDRKEDSVISLNHSSVRNCYISSKLFGEHLLRYNNQGVGYSIIRLCLCYGTGFKIGDNRVLYELIEKAITKGKIELLDDGEAFRSYIHVRDVVNAISNIANDNENGIYNIGGDQKHTIKSIANTIGKLLDCDVKLGPINNRLPGSPSSSYVNIEKYERKFGKLNTVNFIGALKELIKYYHQLYENN